MSGPYMTVKPHESSPKGVTCNLPSLNKGNNIFREILPMNLMQPYHLFFTPERAVHPYF